MPSSLRQKHSPRNLATVFSSIVWWRTEFDQVFGGSSALTGLPASYFNEELSIACPGAKVITVERDFGMEMKSSDPIFRSSWDPWSRIFAFVDQNYCLSFGQVQDLANCYSSSTMWGQPNVINFWCLSNSLTDILPLIVIPGASSSWSSLSSPLPPSPSRWE